ncbi:histone H1-delta-like [Gigantopelta aegis]|uniref:histone H1-delta-like n=1 Tax=Gigantopelta aegis TaxID=1735272 RepID=UPI001B887756|nr:histone H1-delta-like [Gigantopelta aegis]
MSDAASTPVKTPKKKTSKPKTPASHPKYSQMIKVAIAALKERGGSSRQAILNYILKTYKVNDPKTVNQHLKMSLRAGVKNKTLKQSKGTGASGSFRLGDVKPPKAKKPAAKKAKKPKAAKPKKVKKAKSPKKTKTATPKKPKAKKSPKKAADKPKTARVAKPKATKAAKPKATKAAKPKKAKKAKTPKKAAKK